MKWTLCLWSLSLAVMAQAPKLVQDLSFGAERGDDHYLWGHPGTHVVADPQGNIYVADLAANRVLVFDQAGNFQRVFAGKGQGPGQFRGLLRFTATPAGFVALDRGEDSVTRTAWNRTGQVTGTQTRALILEAAQLSQSGRATGLWIALRSEDRARHFISGVLGPDLKPLSVASDLTGPLPNRQRFGDPAYWVDAIAANLQRVEGSAIVHVDSQGRVYTAQRHEAQVRRDSGKQAVTFELAGKPKPRSDEQRQAFVDSLMEQVRGDQLLNTVVTQGVLRKALEKAALPPAAPRIYAITSSERGLVVVIDEVDPTSRATHATLFDDKGHRLGEWRMPDFGLAVMVEGLYLPRISFHGDKLYTIATDEDGENRVLRFALVP